jgi:hypothetical protein
MSFLDDAMRGLARRLRPLYPEMSAQEFDRMVARIAEIELHGEPASEPAVVVRTNRTSITGSRGDGRAA